MKQKLMLFVLVLTVCFQSAWTQQTTTSPDAELAVRFLNKYIQSFNTNIKTDVFLKQSGLVTNTFITKYNAYLNDDDLLFDPVIAAEEFPQAFVLESADPKTGYVIAKGTGSYAKFRVIVKVIQVNGKWIVDGSGLINIPKDKQLK